MHAQWNVLAYDSEYIYALKYGAVFHAVWHCHCNRKTGLQMHDHFIFELHALHTHQRAWTLCAPLRGTNERHNHARTNGRVARCVFHLIKFIRRALRARSHAHTHTQTHANTIGAQRMERAIPYRTAIQPGWRRRPTDPQDGVPCRRVVHRVSQFICTELI